MVLIFLGKSKWVFPVHGYPAFITETSLEYTSNGYAGDFDIGLEIIFL